MLLGKTKLQMEQMDLMLMVRSMRWMADKYYDLAPWYSYVEGFGRNSGVQNRTMDVYRMENSSGN